MKNIIKTTLMMLLAGTIITACDKKTDYPEPVTTTTPIVQTARIKFIHTSPDSPEMKFFINNELVVAGLTNTLSFGQDSPYTTVNLVSNTRLSTTVSDMTKTLFSSTGLDGVVRDIKSVAFRFSTGTGPTAIMGTGNFAAATGVSYSVFYTDVTSRPSNIQSGRSTDIGGPLLDFIVNDNTFLAFPTGSRSIKLRLVHLAVGAPAVKVTIGTVEQTDNTVVATNVAAFTNVAYKNTTQIPYSVNVPTTAPTDNKLVLKNIQVLNNTTNAVLLTIPSVTVDMTKAYTLVAVGIAGTPSFGVKVIQNN